MILHLSFRLLHRGNIMSDLTLSDVSQADFDTAEAILVDLIRAQYPSLDLRRGSVLRDLLIRPAASVYALDTDRLATLQEQMSITSIAENEDTVDPEAIDNILVNFGITRNVGAVATGQVMVRVDAARQYEFVAGFQFATLEGLLFNVSRNCVVKEDADTLSDEIKLNQSDDGTYYYFILPALADEVGANYNISAGTTLDAVSTLFGFVSAEAYSVFSSGLNEESIAEVLTRLPLAISYRALESRTSINAKLQEQFKDTTINIQALSVQGYGDDAQLRDKHNPLGFAVGSRVDIYPRLFAAPQVVTVQKEGTRIAANTYQFTLESADAPGFCALRSISELDAIINPELSFGDLPVLGSYAFTEVRSADGVESTFHDIVTDVEAAFTIYQKAIITVTGVPSAETKHNFKIEAYYDKGLTDIQTYVDSTDVRNLESDYLIRCPLICLVGVDAKVYYTSSNVVDQAKMETDIYNYINSRSFVKQLTRSELIPILYADGATRIDLGQAGMQLQGTVQDASGTSHQLSGDSLDIVSIQDKSKLLTPETVVFAAELESINIETILE